MSERTASTMRGRDVASSAGDAGSLHRKIDDVYDRAETWVAGVGRVLGVDTSGGLHDSRPANASDAPAIAPSVTRALPAASSVPNERPFEIVEVLDAGGRSAIGWHVTNGHEKLGCPSRAAADAVLAHLRKAGK